MRQGSSKAREQLINANVRYVVRIAKQYLASRAPFEDLIGAGNEGLLHAVDKFDASLGFRLISFATWYIEDEVRNTAYNHLRRDNPTLDDYVETDDKRKTRRVDFVTSCSSLSTDWNLRYQDTLNDLKVKAEKRQYGFGNLVEDLHQMLLEGYTTLDFARQHHLNGRQMKHLLATLSEEANHIMRPAA